jgi:hypothetical protein
MMLVALFSLKGSPGVTTFTLALAARWPGHARPLLIEADPSGGDLATRFALAAAPGLVSLTAAVRRNPDPAVLWQHAQVLGGIPIVAAPADGDQARSALSALGQDAGVLRAAAERPNAALLVDCGRIDNASPTSAIVRVADATVLLARSRAEDLAHLPRKLPAIGHWSPRPVLLLAGAGYSPAEVGRELGVPVLGQVPEDPRGAAVLCGRPSGVRGDRRHGPARSAIGQFAHQVGTFLAPRPSPEPYVLPGGPTYLNAVRTVSAAGPARLSGGAAS